MYESFFGLRERPFSLTPDPRFLYMTPQHREALGNITYGVQASHAITLLTGDAGTGKTTLVRAALAQARPGTSYVVVTNPTLTRAEFVRLLATEFSLSPDAALSKAAWLVEIEQMLKARRAKNQITALVLDEAQSFSDELLEEVRLLSNIETDNEKLLPIVMTGQPEISDRLDQPSLRQLKQRISLRCHLAAFDLASTVSYIANRLNIAGGVPSEIFTRNAVVAIHNASRGIPRTINVLCDNALLSGFAAGERPVGQRIVGEVCRDFHFASAEAAANTAPAEPAVAASAADAPASTPAAAAAAPVAGRGQTESSSDMFATVSNRPRRLSFLWTRS